MPPELHHRSSGGTPPQSQPPPPKAKQKFLSLILKAIIMTFITSVFFLLLGLAALLLFNILLVTAVLRHRGRHVHHVRQDNPSDGFSSKHLKKLPQFKFSNGRDCECVVCLDGIRQGQWCRRLVNCGHVFHRKCVDAWLLKAATCPICRTRVQLDSEGGEESSQWTFGGSNLRVC
ncbi:RING-H2 finger protein ATL56 isoform X2 [Tripterygium wilfordii]|uniref:RING-H2 finger protein ATL56 isoform X2 n=1 Tax=Tripterygium wilfordii TaxID=458696 RepID=A0A7J7DSU5_TRIWF|nr:RING-H2 finger protein ATL56-like [Tripterygium wilfordii]KAF5749462.1 RING-H2 finger protein ATL56 isoform X2 [Tripterygium wilfordii]